MTLIGIFDFYFIDGYGLDFGTDWTSILATAFFSGLVAWGAAWLQFRLKDYQDYKSGVQDAYLTFEIIERNSEKILKGIKEYNNYLRKSFYKNGIHKYFDVPKQALNEAPFQYFIHNRYDTVYSYLKKVRLKESDVELYLSGFSSVESFWQNYRDTQSFHSEKFKEYNILASKIQINFLEVANELNALIYSDAHLNLVDSFSRLDIPERALFRKQHPEFEIFQILDKLAESYNRSEKRFIEMLAFLGELREFSNKYGHRLKLISLAQKVIIARSNVEHIKTFYKTFNKTYKSYYSANKEYEKKFQMMPKLSKSSPIILGFFKYLFRK